MRRKYIRMVIGLFCFLGLAIQFIRPEIKNPPVTGDAAVPGDVKATLKRACYDCHSNETNLAWFDKIVPVYWKVAQHVRLGREGLNFSEWDQLPPADQKAKLWEAVNEAALGTMPLKDYQAVHPTAKISASDLAVLENYLQSQVVLSIYDTAKIHAADAQYKKWIQDVKQSPTVTVALNGIAFDPSYKNWTALSFTERFDNGTMRAIMGNDIAVKAVHDDQTNPWPRGTKFAKVAWSMLSDSNGNIRCGAFLQVEFMIKDDQQYASTGGWGFARFKTTQMIPYGKNSLFASECINCHRPMKDNDFVFTIPVAITSLPSVLPFSTSGLKVFASFIDKKQSEMSTLYANDSAFRAALTGNEHVAGQVFTLVTWKQQTDPHWIGAHMPDVVKSVEYVKIHGESNSNEMADYSRFSGPQVTAAADTLHKAERIKYILTRTSAVWP